MRRTLWTAAPAVALVPLLCGAAPATAAAAASTGDVTVTDTESVQVHLDASGSLQDARVFDQLAFAGTGTATVRNPVSTSGLRNLDGFRGWKLEDGDQVATVDVDGERRLRSMSDYDKDLPLSVKVTYTLDGKVVKPGDVVGRSGTLEVHYVVENLTAKTQQVSFADGKGGTATADATTVVPMIGELVTVLPPSFTAVTSQEAAIGGDGRGGTQLQFQMTLFPPIGSATAEFGYSAHISKGVVPKATMTALPVSPLDFPSYKDGSATIKAGGEQGVALTSGAVQIDANLIKLHDGAAQLLGGLLQLKDGAAQLHSGLADTAVPGADQLSSALGGKLAPGAKELANGLGGELAPGAGELADGLNSRLLPGANQLVAGLTTPTKDAPSLVDGAALVAGGLAAVNQAAPGLVDGLDQVAGGLKDVDDGLALLSSTISTEAPAGQQQLHAGIVALEAALGSTSQPTTIIGGLDALRAGSTAGAGQISANANQISAGIAAIASGLASFHVDPAEQAAYTATLQQLAGLGAGAGQLGAAAATLKTTLGTSLITIECGLDASVAGCPAGASVAGGLAQLDHGVSQLVDTVVAGVTAAVGTADPKQKSLRGGVAQLRGGVAELGDGSETLGGYLDDLEAGAAAVSGGVDQVADGNEQLAAGLRTAAKGSSKLAKGAADAAAGSKRLADGAEQAAAGSSQLAAGLHDAADGSGQLADGLGQATDDTTGAPALVAGAQRLHDEGTSQVVASGEETAASFGTQYAVLQANAQRAATEGMAYGAPEGAAGATAYSIEIAGADGAGSKALGLGAAGVVLFGLGAGIATLVRRRLV
ncbi:hypothetical protein [Cellulomonas alba]|uniref:X-X-X-Leu-X-X-Gly heptad repeat-containing protein n=1 Tax=Cellulomonas alba TaxID=3053467 RepID=A0ABT7SI76_9CELL|nr:hypothetical protein [Cellulomonas alba]MDM7855754.1 hypothetical protein [Cellulomonas alba]